MFIASAVVEVIMPDVHTLKEKRQIIKSVIQRTRNIFNVSIAEVDEMDRWQIGVLGLACVSGKSVHANQQLDAVLRLLEEDGRFEMGRIDRELL